MNKKIIAVAMLLTYGTMVSTSCGGGATSVDTASAVTNTPVDSETTDPYEKDDLPKLDFGGKEINVLYRDDVLPSFYVAEQTGDIVDDAVYESNRAVEERLNLKINPITMAGSADVDRAKFMAAITNSVLAGDEAYDLCGVLTYNIPTLMQQGVLSDLLQLPYLNFDKPWWTAALTELATIDGKLYFASGDVSLELTQRLFCMLFNKDLATSLNSGDIYGLVNDGKWTIDKMKELGAAAYADLNGDSTVDPSDRYGVVVNDYNHISGFIGALDIQTVKIGTDGRQHISGDNEHAINAIQKLVEVFNDNSGIFYMNKSDADPSTVSTNHEVYRAMFKDNRLLFVTTEFHQISSIYRDMEAEYGVIPYPKYDEAQEAYYTLARNVYSSFVIPKTCTKTEEVGALLEAMASQNYRAVSPVYFEVALKVKYSRDDTTSQMYDIIRQGLKFNFDFTYSAVTGSQTGKINSMVSNGNTNWTSTYASLKDSAETKLQKFYDDMESMD